MLDQRWEAFVFYVNAYYAVQEDYDSARRNWERPAKGQDIFCRDANPFLWDGQSSAEESVYEGFLSKFSQRFPKGSCTAKEGRALVREWLQSLEGDQYGTALVSALDGIADERSWEESCEPIARQLANRAVRLERTPQDEPDSPNYDAHYITPSPASPASKTPTHTDIDAVIELLAQGDKDFADSLRARLADSDNA